MLLGEVTNPQRAAGIEPYQPSGDEKVSFKEYVQRSAFWMPGTSDPQEWFVEEIAPKFGGDFGKAARAVYRYVTPEADRVSNPPTDVITARLTEVNPVLAKINFTA